MFNLSELVIFSLIIDEISGLFLVADLLKESFKFLSLIALPEIYFPLIGFFFILVLSILLKKKFK